MTNIARSKAVRLTWSTIQDAFAPDPGEHLDRVSALGLRCPPDVFDQLFHAHHADDQFAELVREVDWSGVSWESMEMSGAALNQVGVPRAYEHAVDEARRRTVQQGFFDERIEVMQHWETARTWISSPILLAGEILQSVLQYELVVGFTRLGNLLGGLDREDLAPSALHAVWLGRAQ
jgi:hypothetical protein